jgi:hypothetical protein
MAPSPLARAPAFCAVGGLLFATGLAAALVLPSSSGCIIPDYCIKVVVSGKKWCRYLGDAQMWPIGKPEESVPVVTSDGGPPTGCVCYNVVEQQVLSTKAPTSHYQILLDEIDAAARDDCASLVPAGYDHSCYEPEVSIAESPFPGGSGDCVGDCSYVNPPPGKSCPNPNPFECAGTQPPSPMGETGEGDEGDETGGVLAPGSFIACVGTDCSVDRDVAKMLWSDPRVLAADGAYLEYDSSLSRFEFVEVPRGSVAYALGLRTGDILESVAGTTIDGLDTALAVYADSAAVDSLKVTMRRGQRWIDFTYMFVP